MNTHHDDAAQAERDAEIEALRREKADPSLTLGARLYLDSCIAELHVASGRCSHGVPEDDENGCEFCRDGWRYDS